MSSPCLSSILTHANLTMYQAGINDALLPQLSSINALQTGNSMYNNNNNISNNNLNNNSINNNQWYKQVNPHCWTSDNTLEWISDQVESAKFDASHLSLASCSMDGSILCQMNRDDMIDVFGPQLGPNLHQNLQENRAKYAPELQTLSGSELNETCQLLGNFFDNLAFPLISTVKFGPEPMNPLRDTGYMSDNQSDSDYSCSSSSGMFCFPTLDSPQSSNGESDPEYSYTLPSKANIKMERGESCMKRPRGRPPKISQHTGSSAYDNPKKNKHVPRGTHLWEFIRDILIHPEKNQGLMKWEDRREGVFKFLKSEAVAQMWGLKKKNSSMTYEKLSRAMRYYYKREILERVDGRRLVYKFGKNSTGWKVEDIGLGM